MSGSLIKIDEEIVTSAVAGVTLGASNWDSSYDVYMVTFNNLGVDVDGNSIMMQVLASGSAQNTANYDRAEKILKVELAYGNQGTTNQTSFFVNTDLGLGTSTSETLQGVFYLFNFNNASEYSFWTKEVNLLGSTAYARGGMGGGVYTVQEAHNGLYFFNLQGNNIASGSRFVLYGLKK